MTLVDRLLGRPASGPPDGLVPADRLAAQARRQADGAPPAAPAAPPDLISQRDRLVERFAAMQAELGGVFYEMAIRDHVRMDVLTRKAAELQRVDAELEALERELRGDPGPVVGACPSCGSPHVLGARFCSRCGFALPAPVDGSTAELGA